MRKELSERESPKPIDGIGHLVDDCKPHEWCFCRVHLHSGSGHPEGPLLTSLRLAREHETHSPS